ncbi:MAG: leucine-rich repeat protein [Clostridia bacterium]|nr:leucine-rich repeat protein [Clostridia bacterium]
MKRNGIVRLAVATVSVLLLIAMMLSICTSALGVSSSAPTYINEYNGNLKTNIEQFFNNKVVQKLPSTVKNTDTISVIVDLDLPAIMDAYDWTGSNLTMAEYASTNEAKALMSEALKEKTNILKKLDEKGVKYTQGANYSTIFSGFEILIQACDFDVACDAIGTKATIMVGEVYKPADSKLVENDVNFYEDTGIFNSADFKYQGQGMVVAVLDTGLDYTHTAFLDSNFTADRAKLGLTKKMVADLLLAKDTRAEFYMQGVTADDLYVSDKVPFAFDYADGDADVYSLHNNHGTHVSGVIAGKDSVITGVAPQAQIVSMKTFSDVEESARTSWILSALEDCVLLGVDVINMSLGTACGFSRESDREAINGNVYQKIRDAGISLVVAASNSYNSAYGSDKNGNLGLTSNPDTSTVGSPSTYEGAMSVASIDGKKTPYILYNDAIIYFIEATNASSKEKDFFAEVLKDKIPEDSNEAIELEYVVVPGAGRPADYRGLDVNGKIALVRRGSTTFEEKAQAAQKAGASAIIIYNNVSGDIKMNAGTITIPICSISQDDGELLAASATGKIKISRAQTSGPFISDFSSWGPAPDLSIKPEITAHGGNILSAVTGGDYDRLSGTSMACPNMSGVIALLRQYVTNEYDSIKNMPEGAEKSKATNALVNCLLMSTADIMRNKSDLPYAVRKQGAGLANLVKASTTTAYIQTYDRNDGSVMDKAKIELGDDIEKTGVYTLKFAINNFGTTALTYDLTAQVLTEGVSETETVRGETTVTEEGYILNGAKFEVIKVTNGTNNGNSVSVNGGNVAVVEAKITLSDADKKYLDESFENGMYVEGFVCLKATSGTTIDLSVPFLAFYGDWTKSPMFDTDYFETNKDELDDGISQDDKVMADAYATRPIGGLYSDYVSYLGSYYFQQNPNDKVIAASRDFIALSYADETVHSFRFVWAGILRNAAKIVVTITNDATGEVIFETVDYDIRKSYGDGGSIYPANIDVEFDTQDFDLPNNAQLSVKLEGYLDYDNDGKETNLKNTFEFPIVIDYQAPTVTDCEFYTEYDKDLKKNRLFARVGVYDNHYAMALNFGYVREATDEEYQKDGYKHLMESFESYLTPVYSTFNNTTYVEYELTDYIYTLKEKSKNPNSFVVTCYDYALNMTTYEIGLPDEYVDFYFEESKNETNYLSVNQVYQLKPLLYPNAETNPDATDNPWAELVTFNSTRPKVAKIVNDKIVALSPGVTYIQAKDANGHVAQFHVTVLGSEAKDNPVLSPYYKEYDKPVADEFDVIGYKTLKAFFYLNNDERDIGATNDLKLFEGGFDLKMFPSESVELRTKFTPYLDSAKIAYQSNNTNIVEIDENGVVTAKEEGYASVTVRVLIDGERTFFSETINVEVKNPWIRTGPSLTHYFGNGGVVTIPSNLNLTEVGAYSFSNFDYVEKDENDEISEEDPNLTKQQFLGENTITKVIIPIGIEKIGPYAFAGLTALEEVVIPYTLEAIEYGAFLGCKNLRTISYMDEKGNVIPSVGLKNVKLINMGAFQGCNLRGELVLDNARAIGDYAFADNQTLSSVVIPKTLQSIGGYAFFGNKSLTNVTVHAELVKYGPYVFAGCSKLSSMTTLNSDDEPIGTINTAVIPQGAFYGCERLTSVTVGKDVNVIGEYAFANSGVKRFIVAEGSLAFKPQNQAYILSNDGSELVVVAPTVEGKFELSGVTSVGIGAFAENRKLTEIKLPNVTKVGKYAFAECSRLQTITLGKLTVIDEYSFFGTPIKTHPSFENVTYIAPYAFSNTSLESVVIPNGVTVGEGAFCECDKLASVVIGDNVVLEMGAFMYNNRIGGRWQLLYYVKNNQRHYYYDYISPLKSLTIGDNAVIGESAFMGASDLESVTLGENIVIGDQAFYNACSLKVILDKNGNNVGFKNVVSIGERAFTGDEQFVFTNSFTSFDEANQMIVDGAYVYHYYGAAFEEIDLTNVETIGMGAFAYCTQLVSLNVGAHKDIPELAFYGCEKLESVNLENVETIGNNAFANATSLKEVNLSSATSVGEYAFALSGLVEVTLNENGTDLGMGAFAYCEDLNKVNNLGASRNIASYAFAYSGLTSADITNTETLGDHVFIKEALTPFEVIYGKSLKSVGDNPFALCQVAPFVERTEYEFNGTTYIVENYTFDMTDTVKVVNGSLYSWVDSGYELVTYAGNEGNGVVAVLEGTVRVSSYAFAGSDVVTVQLPHSLNAVGHKAFFDCDSLETVIFRSYKAPILEEQLDVAYYNSYDNIPGSGTFNVELNNGDVLIKEGLGIVDYYMWNVPAGLYYDVFFGANFMNNIGHIDRQLIMIRPSNGQGYENFVYDQYFEKVIDGAISATDETLAAIAAIAKLPRIIKLTDEHLVVAAREAYNKIATRDQQALVTDYATLVSAENKIQRLKDEALNPDITPPDDPNTPNDNPIDPVTPDKDRSTVGYVIAIVVLAVMLVGGAVAVVIVMIKMKKRYDRPLM